MSSKECKEAIVAEYNKNRHLWDNQDSILAYSIEFKNKFRSILSRPNNWTRTSKRKIGDIIVREFECHGVYATVEEFNGSLTAHVLPAYGPWLE